MKTNKLTFNIINSKKHLTYKSESYMYDPIVFKKFLKVTMRKLSLPASARADVYVLLDFLIALVNKKGPDEGIRYIKHCRMYLYQWRSYVPRMSDNSGIARDRDGLPKVLLNLRKRLRSKCETTFRAVLTTLQLSYILKSRNQPNTSTVTQQSTVANLPLKEFSDFLDEIKIADILDKIPEWSEPHFSSKSGPNGQVMATCGVDLHSVPDSLFESLCTLGGPNFTQWAQFWRQFPLQLQKVTRLIDNTYKDPSSLRYRKLTYVDSPEGKKRVIAIFDYWSQTVLKPVHDWSFDQLRKFEADCTFNQNHGKIDFDWEYAESIDLSAATDRFPIGIQSVLLEKIIGPAKTRAWEDILVGYEFPVSWTKYSTSVKYSVGQPMGAYSSWGIFSLCHHLVVQWSAKRAGANLPFKRYRLLGDDIVIFDKEVAFQYRNLIQSLGVEISKTKSLQSRDCYEFAKRFFTRTSELTSFPIASLFENTKSTLSIWSSLMIAEERGYEFCRSISRPSSVADYAAAAKLNVRRFKVRRYTELAESIYTLSRRDIDEYEQYRAVNSICKLLNIPVSCNMSTPSRLSLVSRLLIHFMKCRLINQIQENKLKVAKIARVANFGLEIHPESGKVDEPTRVELSLTPQFHALQSSIEGSDALVYEIEELIDQSQGSASEKHFWIQNASRTFSLLSRVSLEGFSEHTNQSVMLLLRKSVTQAALDMSSLVSRRPNQCRIEKLSAFIRFCIEGVESSNKSRWEALS